jgi:hypothetical protein
VHKDKITELLRLVDEQARSSTFEMLRKANSKEGARLLALDSTSFVVRTDQEQRERSLCGYFAYLSDGSLSAREVVDAYAQRMMIECSFKNFKERNATTDRCTATTKEWTERYMLRFLPWCSKAGFVSG